MRKEVNYRICIWNNRYIIGSDGSVVSNQPGKETYERRATKCEKSGYMLITIGKKTVALHRLVAEHFLPGFTSKCRVSHKDGNTENNQLDNLYIKFGPGGQKVVGTYSKHKNRYQTTIKIEGKRIHSPYYKTREESQQWYYDKFLETYGLAPWDNLS